MSTALYSRDGQWRVEAIHRTCAKGSGQWLQVCQHAPKGGWYVIAEVRTPAEVGAYVDLGSLTEHTLGGES